MGVICGVTASEPGGEDDREGKYHNDSIEQVDLKDSSKIVQIWNMSLLWILWDS